MHHYRQPGAPFIYHAMWICAVLIFLRTENVLFQIELRYCDVIRQMERDGDRVILRRRSWS